jgi:hypothetical protein
MAEFMEVVCEEGVLTFDGRVVEVFGFGIRISRSDVHRGGSRQSAGRGADPGRPGGRPEPEELIRWPARRAGNTIGWSIDNSKEALG